jgi:hypothetical protein
LDEKLAYQGYRGVNVMVLGQQQFTVAVLCMLAALGCGDDSGDSNDVDTGGDAAIGDAAIGDAAIGDGSVGNDADISDTTEPPATTSRPTSSETETTAVTTTGDAEVVDASADASTDAGTGTTGSGQVDSGTDGSGDTTESTDTDTTVPGFDAGGDAAQDSGTTVDTSNDEDSGTGTTDLTSTDPTEPVDASDASDELTDADVETDASTSDTDVTIDSDAAADGGSDAGDAAEPIVGEIGPVWEQTQLSGVLVATGENAAVQDPAGTFCISGDSAEPVVFKYNVNQPESGGILGTYKPQDQLDFLTLNITGLDYSLRLLTPEGEYCADLTSGTESVVFNDFYECGEASIEEFHYHRFPIWSIFVEAESTGPYEFCVAELDAEFAEEI